MIDNNTVVNIPRFVALCGPAAEVLDWFVFVRASDEERVTELVELSRANFKLDLVAQLTAVNLKINDPDWPQGTFEPQNHDIRSLDRALRVLHVTKSHKRVDRGHDYGTLDKFRSSMSEILTILPVYREQHKNLLISISEKNAVPSRKQTEIDDLLELCQRSLVLLNQRLVEPLPRQIAEWHSVLYLIAGRLEAIFAARNYSVPPLWTGAGEASPYLVIIKNLLADCNDNAVASVKSIKKQIELGRREFGSLSAPSRGGVYGGNIPSTWMHRRFP